MQDADFQLNIQSLLSKYDGTPLQSRWQEAISFGSGFAASDYWIRDSDDVVNIVWLNSDGIRDIGMFRYPPSSDDENPIFEAAFTFVPFRSIASVDVREGQDIARRAQFPASGSKMVLVTLAAPRGHLYWIANLQHEMEQLGGFVTSVLSAYLNNR